jgi:hypothetical protein
VLACLGAQPVHSTTSHPPTGWLCSPLRQLLACRVAQPPGRRVCRPCTYAQCYAQQGEGTCGSDVAGVVDVLQCGLDVVQRPYSDCRSIWHMVLWRGRLWLRPVLRRPVFRDTAVKHVCWNVAAHLDSASDKSTFFEVHRPMAGFSPCPQHSRIPAMASQSRLAVNAAVPALLYHPGVVSCLWPSTDCIWFHFKICP